MTIEQAIDDLMDTSRSIAEVAELESDEANRINAQNVADDCKQIAEWLRELVERRKAPEIIRCTECKNKSFCPSKIDCGDGLYWYVRFCSRGEQDEKRTDD